MLAQTKLTWKELLWHGVIFFAVAFTAFEAPFSFTFATRIQQWQLWSDSLISLVFISDVLYRLRSIYKKKSAIPTNKQDKLMWYLFLLIDIIAAIPFDMIAYHYNLGGHFQVLSLIRLFRLVRLFKIFSLMGHLTIVPPAIKISSIAVGALITLHWIACGWILIYPTTNLDITSYYIKSLYWATATLTTIGYGDITPTTNAGRLYTMIVMILGVGVYGFVIGYVARTMSQSDRHKEYSKEKVTDLANFMRYYNIPERLQSAAFSYYNHLITKRLTENDSTIISDLPQALQQELQTYMNMKLIGTVPVFKHCSIACLKDVASALERKYYSPGQTVIQIGEVGQEMYIIGHGIVEVILKDGNAVASLHEGQCFGEAALLKETMRNASVRAQQYCDLYKLKKEDFLEIIKKHPDLLENMQKITSKRSTDRRK
jgi:voltage-gated potassium channel